MSSEAVRLSREGGIATITLNRPQSLNALDMELAEALLAAVMRCEADGGVRVVVIGGAGRSFCAGGDVKAMAETLDGSPSGYLKELLLRLHPTIVSLHRMPKPVIARVHGAVAGAGVGLALACDLTVAADTARFSTAYLRLGLSPDGGTSYYLARMVGMNKALELLLTAETIDATEAHRLGLVNRLVPEADLESVTSELAQRLAGGPASAIAAAKDLVRRAHDETLESQLEYERRAIALNADTDDFREGVRAFLERREPRFQER